MAKPISNSSKESIAASAARAKKNSTQFSVNKAPKHKDSRSLPTAGAESGVGRLQKAK